MKPMPATPPVRRSKDFFVFLRSSGYPLPRILRTMGILLTFANVTHGSNRPLVDASDIQVSRNIRYAPPLANLEGTPSDRLLDIYAKSTGQGERLPVFLFIHGGGFSGGDKGGISNICIEIARRNIIALSINYRLTKGADFKVNMKEGIPPGGFKEGMLTARSNAATDAILALKWIKGNESKYPFDLRRVAVSGGSAGAVAALFVAYLSKQTVLPIGAVVSLWGGVEDAGLVSPQAPPLLLFHGDKDDVIHVSFSQALQSRFETTGVPCDLVILKGKGHAQYPLIAESHMDTIGAFLEKVMANGVR